ncbi:site-2 protease family protein [uncultured Kordia sp.]|uniref:site-2 protease family protein n=1 Tax=uncultured Kordia sp. TaxID=507699 RepID=UPI0026171BCB|nr:site-2 protease family protein [uncultured Kordia sp.]
MDLNTAAIYFGVSAVIIMFLFNIFHCMLASIFGVRIERFGMLTSFGDKHILKFKRHQTEYCLGWIPTGGFVKISGMIDERLDTSEPFQIEDYMLLSKPPIVRIICTIGAPILLLIPFLISINFIAPSGSLSEGFQIIIDILHNIYQYISGTIDVTQTESNWNTITNTANLFPIILALLTLIIAISSTISMIVAFMGQKAEKALIFLYIVMLVCYIYLLYKLGALYFSMYSFSDFLVSLLKFVVPIYIFCTLIMLFIKILPKNKYI